MKEKKQQVKISFGMIVLNGEMFIEYNLRSLYPFAHEIIIVEGACENAKNISTEDGHSRDNTLEVIKDFQNNHDPENKVKLITKTGFWEEKDEQSKAYAKVATGNYLWQVDMDEFYKEEDMKKIIQMLKCDDEIMAVSFKQITFWGDLKYKVDSLYLRGGADIYHRLFKWGKGYEYKTHRPPTVLDENGVDLRELKWVKADKIKKEGIFMYHYSLLFLSQVREKAHYYSKGPWGDYSDGIVKWCKNNFLNKIKFPFQLHNYHPFAGWIERNDYIHPKEAVKMFEDAKNKENQVRNCDDVEMIINNNFYKFIVLILKLISGYKYVPYRRISKIFFKFIFDYKNNKIKFKYE